MRLEDVARPTAAGDEYVVRVEAAAVNFLDMLMMRGLYQVKPPLSFTPGIEIVGVVVERPAEPLRDRRPPLRPDGSGRVCRIRPRPATRLAQDPE